MPHETIMRTEEQIRVGTPLGKRSALSVAKCTGRAVLYKTIRVTENFRGRPFLGQAGIRSLVIKNDVRFFDTICFSLRFLFRDATVS